jgi:hypothetical protein
MKEKFTLAKYMMGSQKVPGIPLQTENEIYDNA